MPFRLKGMSVGSQFSVKATLTSFFAKDWPLTVDIQYQMRLLVARHQANWTRSNWNRRCFPVWRESKRSLPHLREQLKSQFLYIFPFEGNWNENQPVSRRSEPSVPSRLKWGVKALAWSPYAFPFEGNWGIAIGPQKGFSFRWPLVSIGDRGANG